MLEIGTKAPEFCLPNQDGVEICWRDLVGQWLVVYFYPKDMTPGCTTEACEFSDALDGLEQLDCGVVGVSADSIKRHKMFIDKYNLKFMLISDESTSMLSAWGVWKMKKNYGKEYMGIVRTTYIIAPDGSVAARFDNVKVKGHVEAVTKKLQELQKN